MNFLLENYIQSLKKSFDFNGKTTRKEYFSFLLVNGVVFILLAIFVPFSLGLFQLFTLFANISILIRRFRDADVSPWSILLILPIYVVIFLKSK